MKTLKNTLLALFLVILYSCEKEKPDNWTDYTNVSGTTGQVIHDIILDSDILWFTTSNGLLKYDGTEWTRSDLSNSGIMEPNNVQSIHIDKNKIMWLGSINGRISTFNGTDFKTIEPLIEISNTTAIEKILSDAQNNLWFCTSDNGVIEYDGVNWKNYIENDGLAGISVLSMAIDKDGSNWFATTNGISKFDGTNWTNYLEHEVIYSIAFDNNHNVWFSGIAGIWRLEDDKFINYSDHNVYGSIAVDENNNIWFGGVGIRRYNYNQKNGNNT